jgi:hypothetical protein
MKPADSGRQALLFLCHRQEPGFIRRFRALARAFKPYGDAYFIVDSSTQPVSDAIRALRHSSFSLESLKSLGYAWMHEDLMPGHVHFPLMDFAARFPDYTHYWVIEYDVRFSGPWRLFFWRMQFSRADFLATHLSHHEDQPSWWWWDTFSSPDSALTRADCARFFGPLYRISRPALTYVDAALKAGYSGHQELILPTLLMLGRFKIQDLSTRSSFPCPTRWSWYTRKDTDIGGGLGESSMRFHQGFAHQGRRLLTLYHPIKTPASNWVLQFNRLRRKIGLLPPTSKKSITDPGG